MGEELEQVRADADSTADGVVVSLVTDAGKEDIRVPPPGRWKSRANTMLREGDFDGWARTVLTADDWARWSELDPTNDEVKAFFEGWAEATGESVGKSSRSSNGSTPIRRR